jgi:PAS domain S-box-containing protein
MDISSHVNNNLLQLFIVTAASIGAILTSIFSLSHGIFVVFPFLYLLSIILVVYFNPRYGVPFSLGISLVYIGLVFFFALSTPTHVAIAIGWCAIFIMIGVVTSSYANRMHNEEKKIKKVLDTAQDGIFCFDLRTMRLHEINQKCARMLHYEREDLLGKAVTLIWTSEAERADFLSCIKRGEGPCHKEVMLRAKDGTHRRYLISAILTASNLVLCFTIDTTQQKFADEEIWQTLGDLEREVVERTVHLEKINEELKAEILKRRQAGDMYLHEEHKNDGTVQHQ